MTSGDDLRVSCAARGGEGVRLRVDMALNPNVRPELVETGEDETHQSLVSSKSRPVKPIALSRPPELQSVPRKKVMQDVSQVECTSLMLWQRAESNEKLSGAA